MKFIFSFFCIGLMGWLTAQEIPLKDTIKTKQEEVPAITSPEEIAKTIDSANAPQKIKQYNPTKAGLYSAVLPGLGQYYNKKYWKIPIVWGAVGTGVGIALWNDRQYKRYRNAFIAQLNGIPHEFSDIPGITADALGRVQDQAKRQRDYAIAITGLIYILNIVDAVVDAHLYEGRHDPDLAIKPVMIQDFNALVTSKAGLSLSYRF